MDIISPIRIALRTAFRPWNRLRIRNCPRSFTEPSQRTLHAVFSLLCEYVEEQVVDYGTGKYGRDGLAERVAALAGKPGAEPSHRQELELLRLYDWYVGVDWSDPVPGWGYVNGMTWAEAYEQFDELAQKNLEAAVAQRRAWWT